MYLKIYKNYKKLILFLFFYYVTIIKVFEWYSPKIDTFILIVILINLSMFSLYHSTYRTSLFFHLSVSQKMYNPLAVPCNHKGQKVLKTIR